MKDLTSKTLSAKYNEMTFINQLKEAGIPESTINEMRTNTFGEEAQLLYWLYDDIKKGEAKISNGIRYSRIVGIFCTDRKYVLLERDSILGKKGEQYKLGGQIPVGANPTEIALQELSEETPIIPQEKNLIPLGTLKDRTETSPKLPGIMSYKEMVYYKYLIETFDHLKEYIRMGYTGRDGYKHDLLLLPIEAVLKDERVKDSYKKAFKRFYHELLI